MAEIGPEYSFYFNYNAIGEMIGFMCRVEDDGTGSSAETQYIFVKNQQGDVEKIIRSWDQTIVASYSYDAWGNPIEWSGPMAERNPIRYRGYYYDTETGFYYLQSRYYDPQTGRFINTDDPGLLGADSNFQSYSLFVYCGNNPVNKADLNGALAGWVVGGIVGALIGGISSAINDTIMGREVTAWSVLKGAAVGAASGIVSSIISKDGIAAAFSAGVTFVGSLASGVGIGESVMASVTVGISTYVAKKIGISVLGKKATYTSEKICEGIIGFYTSGEVEALGSVGRIIYTTC